LQNLGQFLRAKFLIFVTDASVSPTTGAAADKTLKLWLHLIV
jgi:hypothetical protein